MILSPFRTRAKIMYHIAIVLLLCVLSTEARDHNDVNRLARMILESKTFPSVNNFTAAKEFALLLKKEFVNYKLATLDQGPTPPGLSAFDCPINGPTNPTNARRLTPADINVVASLGDSIAAGFGALSSSIFTIFTEYRGYAFTAGGETDYSDYVTIPNIIKLYNPKVKGFAVGNGGQDSINSKLNVAVSGARSYDLGGQLLYLIEKMPTLGVDMENDWKIISIFVGGNDLCDYCGDTNAHSPAKFRANIEGILDTIKTHIPRVYVNLVSPPDVTLLGQVSSGFCSLLHAYECGCATDTPRTTHAHMAYTTELEDLAKSEKYQDKEDFFVTVQPFLKALTLPLDSNGDPDRSYFAPDCFHFSGKAHQAAAVALWNNMVETTDKKESWVPGEPLECPEPYLA